MTRAHPAIAATGLRKSFGDQPVLDGVEDRYDLTDAADRPAATP